MVKRSKLNSFPVVLANHEDKINESMNDSGQSIKKSNLLIHDMSFSMNDREFACVSSKYIMIYSMDTISEKRAGDIFSIYQENAMEVEEQSLTPSEMIHIGRDTNLFYCKYHPKNYLVVAGTNKKYWCF